jgi:hypothetical protein
VFGVVDGRDVTWNWGFRCFGLVGVHELDSARVFLSTILTFSLNNFTIFCLSSFNRAFV